MIKKYELTPEHREQLKPWAEKWIANGMSTKPMDDDDKAAMVEALKGQYEAANLPWHGRVVFVPSPVVARFAAGSWPRERQEEFSRSVRPQALTARNAVASTFGLRGEDYAPVMES